MEASHVHVLISTEAYARGFPDVSTILDDSEMARLRAFARPADSLRFQAAHIFVREVLSTYLPLTLDSWRFRYEPGGAPFIDWDALPVSDSINFNLSHSGSAVACAVRRALKIGVDVQEMIPAENIPILSRIALSEAEKGAVTALGDDGRASERVTMLWALKEAYLKALGVGLSMDPQRLGFVIDKSGEPHLHVDGINVDSWEFKYWLHPRYILAVALEKPGSMVCSPELVLWENSQSFVYFPHLLQEWL